MKFINVLKCTLLAFCISGVLYNPALAKKGYHDKWDDHRDRHYYGNDRHGYQINNSNYARGRVIDVVPIYKNKKRRQQNCWLEPSPRYQRQHYNNLNNHQHRRNETIDTIAGAVIGGVIGNQFGSGNGNKIATVAGAVIGGKLANDYTSNGYKPSQIKHHRNNGFVEVCENNAGHGNRHFGKITGYHVTYRYKGDIYRSITRRHPGKYIDLVVSVIPRE